MKIAIAQYNPKVGDLKGNISKTIEFIEKAKERDCDLVVFPELSLTGYPPRDLLLRDGFLKACDKALEEIMPSIQGIGALIGTVIDDGNGFLLYNSALLIQDGEIIGLLERSIT